MEKNTITQPIGYAIVKFPNYYNEFVITRCEDGVGVYGLDILTAITSSYQTIYRCKKHAGSSEIGPPSISSRKIRELLHRFRYNEATGAYGLAL